MALRGAKLKPFALKRITSKRATNPHEPDPGGRPTPPTPLTGRAEYLWNAHIAPAWWLSSADSTPAWMWAVLYAEFESDPASMTAARISQLRALGSSLGFDPASRTRLGTPPDRPNTDPADKYF